MKKYIAYVLSRNSALKPSALPRFSHSIIRVTAVFCLAFFCSTQSVAQSYESMESRFYKPQLDQVDTAAFIALGVQKAQSLFAQSQLHLSNAGNTANQAYIVQRLPDLFFVAEGDSLDVEAILAETQKAKLFAGTNVVQFAQSDAPDYLCKIESTNCRPVFVFYLVLKKSTKKFGKKQDEIWEVFLTKPEIIK